MRFLINLTENIWREQLEISKFVNRYFSLNTFSCTCTMGTFDVLDVLEWDRRVDARPCANLACCAIGARSLPLPEEVERPRNASKEEWLSRSRRAASPSSFNRIRKPVGETSVAGHVAWYTPDTTSIYVCVCVRDVHACARYNTRTRALPYAGADKPGKTSLMPLSYEAHARYRLRFVGDPSVLCVKARRALGILLILKYNGLRTLISIMIAIVYKTASGSR